MAANPPNLESAIVPAQELRGVEIIAHPRQLHMYHLTRDELDGLRTAGNYKSLDIAMLSLCVGVFVASLLTLVTVAIADTKVFSSFVAATIVTGLASVFFGIRALLAWRNANKQFRTFTGIHE